MRSRHVNLTLRGAEDDGEQRQSHRDEGRVARRKDHHPHPGFEPSDNKSKTSGAGRWKRARVLRLAVVLSHYRGAGAARETGRLRRSAIYPSK